MLEAANHRAPKSAPALWLAGGNSLPRPRHRQTEKARQIGLKLGFGVLQGVPSTHKTGTGSDLDTWFTWYFHSSKNMIMYISYHYFQPPSFQLQLDPGSPVTASQWGLQGAKHRHLGGNTPTTAPQPITSYISPKNAIITLLWTTLSAVPDPFVRLLCLLKERKWPYVALVWP